MVPIILGEDEDIINEKLSKLNGVLFPGGGGGYIGLGKYVFDKLLDLNKNGTYYPLWGTCLGFEYFLEYSASAGSSVKGDYDYHGSMTMEFVVNPKDT